MINEHHHNKLHEGGIPHSIILTFILCNYGIYNINVQRKTSLKKDIK